MGTRSLTYVYERYDNNNTPVVCMYRQYDGYLEGHGLELATFLTRGRLVNGLSGKDQIVFNGMGCLAAQMVAHFKKESGNFYLHSTESDQDCGQEYEYHVFYDRVVVYSVGTNNNNVLFEGTWMEFFNMCQRKEQQYQDRAAAMDA
jgi:hypothetical protein